MKEFFFDDDTLTDNMPRVEEIARRLGRLGMTVVVQRQAERAARDAGDSARNGLRLLLVGYESGNQQVLNNMKKGTRLDIAREFSQDCRELGIKVHGTFILGMPGETPETIRETIHFACEIEPETIQVSLRRAVSGHVPLPAGARAGLAGDPDRRTGRYARRAARGADLPEAFFDDDVRIGRRVLSALLLPAAQDVLAARRDDRSPEVMKRRLREGVEFFHFLHERKKTSTAVRGGSGQSGKLNRRVALPPSAIMEPIVSSRGS